MSDTTTSDALSHTIPQAPVPTSALYQLLAGVSTAGPRSSTMNRLASARLGVASSLFAALRTRDPNSAHHALRVALYCSSFASAVKLDPRQRDVLEVAALLHDVGKIGVPDKILHKSSRLTDEEAEIMDWHRHLGLEILEGCCGSSGVMQTVKYAPYWYDGSRPAGAERKGRQLPLTSRILAIADAYDSMTTDRVYRRALSRERAVAELFQGAASQFDPNLVKIFASLSKQVRADVDNLEAHRWLHRLTAESTNALWQLRQPLFLAVHRLPLHVLFYQRMLDMMHDGVIFVDATGRIMLWNRAAERLTGIQASSVHHRQWSPKLLRLRDMHGNALRDDNSPVQIVLNGTSQSVRRYQVQRPDGGEVKVDIHAFPLLGHSGRCQAVAMILHDASSESELEEQVIDLHHQARRDGLTQVANRAELDCQLQSYVDRHLKAGVPCSVIICDLDRFKQVNDIYGHQAGDEALKIFAQLLKQHCRQTDLVARYGGEEFVVVCADCDNATASQRAEEIRLELSSMPIASLGGRRITASFGVTELQPGDTAETIVRRADRALLEAKDAGRNRVVQVGIGLGMTAIGEHAALKPAWGWWRRRTPSVLLRRELVSHMPQVMVAEKIRGFVADHQAQVLEASEGHAVLAVDVRAMHPRRRMSDRLSTVVVELELRERPGPEEKDSRPTATHITVSIRPRRDRDRRRSSSDERINHLMQSLISYLMAVPA